MTIFRKFCNFLKAYNLFSSCSFMNFDTLAVHLGTNRVPQEHQKRLKVPLFSQKRLGRIFGLLFEKFGLLFDQTVWSH